MMTAINLVLYNCYQLFPVSSLSIKQILCLSFDETHSAITIATIAYGNYENMMTSWIDWCYHGGSYVVLTVVMYIVYGAQ